MERLNLLSSLARPANTKILMYVIDGVSGVPHPERGMTELEAAHIPNLDSFCARATNGRINPIGTGITPGSGPGHLALFGYPPLAVELSRGVLEVLGATRTYRDGHLLEEPYELARGDLTARGNFATVEPGSWVVRDRRGGGLTDEVNERLIAKLSAEVRIEGIETYLFPGKQHRFAVAFRGPGLTGPLTDTDPQKEGLAVLPVTGVGEAHGRSVEVVQEFMSQVHDFLGPDSAPNFGMMRGIGTPPALPTLVELYGLKPVALAYYPMYRGVARLVGMDIIPVKNRAHQLAELHKHLGDYDFFFVHVKEPDSFGHQGDFAGKAAELEKIDEHFGQVIELPFDVIILTGDHSTPTMYKDHSHHPIPTAVWSRTGLADNVTSYSERACLSGALGTIAARDLLGYALAESGRLLKFGA